MKRLLIYPALVPVMAMLSAWAAIGQRELMVPAVLSMSSVKPNVDLFAMLILGVPFVLPAMLLDAWRHKRRDCPLEELIRLGAMQWFWLTLYASLAILLNWTLVPALQSVTDFPIQQYLYWGDEGPYPVQIIACLWAVERVTRRKPSPSPAFLWHRWKRSWTLTTENKL